MRFAYADPPYLGCCSLYGHNHPAGPRPFDGRCWDDVETHHALLAWLTDFDGFAVSASSPSLPRLLGAGSSRPHIPLDTRIAVWAKSFCAFKKGVRPCYAWEPVLFWSKANPPHQPHAPPLKGGKQNTPKDFFVGPITLKKGLTGAKSEAFCRWVLDLLNFRPGDELVEVFPETDGMARALLPHPKDPTE